MKPITDPPCDNITALEICDYEDLLVQEINKIFKEKPMWYIKLVFPQENSLSSFLQNIYREITVVFIRPKRLIVNKMCQRKTKNNAKTHLHAIAIPYKPEWVKNENETQLYELP